MWCSRPGRPLPAKVTEFPSDVSVYGIQGLVGNSQDWCTISGDPGHATYRGSAWSHSFLQTPAYLLPIQKNVRTETAGVRLVRSL